MTSNDLCGRTGRNGNSWGFPGIHEYEYKTDTERVQMDGAKQRGRMTYELLDSEQKEGDSVALK